jgi:hypothetical protein
MLVDEDFEACSDVAPGERGKSRPILAASGAIGNAPDAKCPPGTFSKFPSSSPMRRKEVFLQRTFGMVFPDAAEALIEHHENPEKRNDPLSALVTSEWYTNQSAFRGWSFAHSKNAFTLKKHDRRDEARDAARVALACAPWWTLGAEENIAMTLAEMAGVRSQILLHDWTAERFRDALDTGGEEYRKAAAAMDPGSSGSGSDLENAVRTSGLFYSTELEKKACELMDAVALGAPADVSANGKHLDWDAIRFAVSETYEEAGLCAYAEFVRGE